MKTRPITLPSGLAGEIRKFKAGDWHLLVDPAYSRNVFTALMSTLAARVWVKTTSKGPYVFEDTPPFSEVVLIGDRQYLLTQCRCFTSRTGGVRPIRIRCQGCNSWFDWILDFADLPVQKLSDEAKTIFQSGKPFKTKLGAGPVIHWEMAAGKNYADRIMPLVRKHGGSQQAEIAGRILEIDGQKLSTINKEERRDQVFNWVCDLDEEDFYELSADVERHECGLETSFPVQCTDPNCGFRFRHEAEVLGFILPESGTRSAQSASSPSTISPRPISGNDSSG